MSSLPLCRRALLARKLSRSVSTTTTSSTLSPAPTTPDTEFSHFKITLRRSAISLGERMKGTLAALGIHRRNQTVYHKHSPDIAGKILRLKELVEVENVRREDVRNKWEQRQDRKAVRGYTVVGNKKDTFMHV